MGLGIFRMWITGGSLIFSVGCAREGRSYDWGASCSEIKQNHREISRIEEKLEALEKQPASVKNAEAREGLLKRKRRLLKDSDDAQQDCRPAF